MEALDAKFTRLEFRFGFRAATEFIDGSAIFRAEAIAKSLRLLFAVQDRSGHRDQAATITPMMNQLNFRDPWSLLAR
jgi:hypothetical protein